MDKQQLFTGIEDLLVLLTEHRKSGTLTFKSADDKALLRAIYKDIYPQVSPDLNCVTCILSYLNNLQAWYEREHPKYLKTLDDSALNPTVDAATVTSLNPEQWEEQYEAVSKSVDEQVQEPSAPAEPKKRKGKR